MNILNQIVIDLRLDEVKKIIDKHSYVKVIVLLPAGLMPRAQDLAKIILEPIFLASPCYGACDVPLHFLEKFNADALFNFGHSETKKFNFPENVHFFEIQVRGELPNFIPDFNRIGLVYVIQYKDAVKKYAKLLENAGKIVVWGGEPDFMAKHPAQITGCDIGAADKIKKEVDGFVIASNGVFHANAVASLGPPTYNWQGEKATPLKYPIAALFMAKKVAVVTSIKPGQFYGKEAEEVAKKLKNKGKEVIFIAGDVFSSEITNFGIDFWVIAACPRIAEDSYMKPAAPVEIVLEYLNE